MTCFKDISYMLSHVFFVAFLYLFLPHRYSRAKTFAICFASFTALNLLDLVKLNLFPGSRLCYFITDLVQIFAAQSTGLLISRKRNSRVLFIGLSASNYVIVGSITASILYLYTENFLLSLAGNLLMHLAVLLVLYYRIGNILLQFAERDTGKSWWELCLIPVLFFCSFSCLAFFPYTLYELPENTLVSIFLMITMIASYIVVLRYLDSATRQMEEYWKNIMFESYIKGLENQNYLAEQSERNLRILRHDMRHYSMTIASLLDQGEYEEIRKLAEHINKVTDENRLERYCENLVANTILLRIAGQAKALGIALHLDVSIPRQLPANEYEFAMVLANLLENAVSGAKEPEPQERRIDAKIHCTAEYILADISNSYAGEIRFDPLTGLPKSEKGSGHGLGMQSVLAFSDKLGGNLDCYCENGRFRLILYANLCHGSGSQDSGA